MNNTKLLPVINEKAIFGLELENEQYTFDVSVGLSKKKAKALIENIFQLEIEKLTTQIQPRRRTTNRIKGTSQKGSKFKRIRVKFKKPAPLITQYYSLCEHGSFTF